MLGRPGKKTHVICGHRIYRENWSPFRGEHKESVLRIAAPFSGSCRSSTIDTLAVHLPNSYLVVYLSLNKGVNPGTQLTPNKQYGKPARKCAINRGYALIKQMHLTASQYGMSLCHSFELHC